MGKPKKTTTKEKKEQIGKVYKITSPTGRIYIGSTTQEIYKRWYKYVVLDCDDQPKIYNSLKKYGADVHIFEVIWEGLIEDSLKMERLFGDKFMVLGPMGLNCQLPGYDGIPRICSAETLIKMSEAQKGEKHHHYGKKYPQEVRDKLKIARSGCKNHMYGKRAVPTKSSVKINQYDLDGKFIKTFNSHAEVSLVFGLDKNSIRWTLDHNHYVKMDFIWIKYTGNINDLDISNLPIRINKLDLGGNFIEVYRSIELAARSLNGFSESRSVLSIRNCLSGHYDNTMGYKWSYAVDYFNTSAIDLRAVRKSKQKDIKK